MSNDAGSGFCYRGNHCRVSKDNRRAGGVRKEGEERRESREEGGREEREGEIVR
jgi:hypothetical protein